MEKRKSIKRSSVALPHELVEQKILLIRGHRVLLDADLAQLYRVETRALLQAVKRNRSRFPADFMFQLSRSELENWRSQFVMSNPNARMGLRRPPYAFTEQGVAMLSSVLKSKRAIAVNIQIMRTFVKLREILSTHKDLARKLDELEAKYDEQFTIVFDAIRKLMGPPTPRNKRRIGYL